MRRAGLDEAACHRRLARRDPVARQEHVMRMARRVLVVAVALAAVAAHADEPAAEADAERIRALEQRLDAVAAAQRILVRQLERERQAAAAKAEVTPIVTFGRDGFVLQLPDGATKLRVHGYLQADGRAYFDDDAHAIADTFLLRRVRPMIDATFFGWLDARIMPDFGTGESRLQDAYIDVHPFAWLRLHAGKDKAPVGLERLQSARALRFAERGLPADVVPNRDVGAQLWGSVADGLFDWAAGVFNGVVDGADNGDVDLHDGKDFAARAFCHPFRPLDIAALAGLGLGVAGTYGKDRGTAAAPNLPTYKSPGQVTFFSYLADPTRPDGATRADGDRWHVAPQLYYSGGPIGVLAEYVRSAQQVVRGARRGTVVAQAWQVQVSALLTPGDRETYDVVQPQRPLADQRRGYGAFELVARYSELRVGDAAFPVFADPTKSARAARDFGVGLNWWVNAFFRAGVSFDRTDFSGGAASGDRAPENVLIGRLQVAF
jgi:phosphate-selective porin OprO/OprP